MKPRVQMILGIAVVAALLVVGVLLWIDRMRPVEITITQVADQSIVVSISGEVVAPGVVEVPVGARLQQVVEAAGGFTGDADLAALNLAGRVGDGEHIDIPAVGDPASGAASGPAPDTVTSIDLNTATVADLDRLPGIGDVLATRIVEYRDANGPFTSIDQLANIEGISPRLVEELRPYVTISQPE